MRQALEEAIKGEKENEVPVGAVLVFKNQIISRAYNQVESLKDPTAHAEKICIQRGSSILNNWRLLDCTLYSTLEPCAMCAGAIFLSRVKRVVWGAPDAHCKTQDRWLDILQKNYSSHLMKIDRGILEKESVELMKNFFQKRREYGKTI